MIRLSDTFDLGRDHTRMKDPRDGLRQTASAAELLGRLFDDDPERRWELQILADEVGMGKTFVALAVAFSLLEDMMGGRTPDGLEGCYQKIVILTPPNTSLLRKWYREVSEFVKRCVPEGQRDQAKRWFNPTQCERLDDFVRSLRRRGGGSRVIVASMDIFGDKKLRDYDVKRRFLLGALFCYWGNRLQNDRRERLLRGAPADWPQRPDQLSDFDQMDIEKFPCSEEDAVEAIRRLDRPTEDGKPSLVEQLLGECRDISEPFTRDRDQLFKQMSSNLNSIYREMVLSLLGSPVPLVIVDEAHNWKNGPTTGANGYRLFARYLASRTRRALLLTATPFQLRPQEMLELLKIGEALQPAPERSGAQERRERFRAQREDVLDKVLDSADRASRRFAKTWSKLSAVTLAAIQEVWLSEAVMSGRARIDELARLNGVVDERALAAVVKVATEDLDPSVRSFFAEALVLYAHNRDLASELGPMVVRHRRKTEHRVFRVGREYGCPEDLAGRRPDRYVLHAALGLDVRGAAELPHYLLMRCVSDTKKGRGRSSLGSALTGCYSTLLGSAEGKRVKDWIATQTNASRHFGLLLSMVDSAHDPEHPKLAAVVEQVLQAWRHGEKTLLFCFRTNTAERLHEIIRDRITSVLNDQRKACLGGESSLVALRARLTGRDRDLMPLGLDRVLWSLSIAEGAGHQRPFDPSSLDLQDGDVEELARLSLRHNVALDEERVDRVFLTRAVEHVVARRLLAAESEGIGQAVLRKIASSAWVEWPYGLDQEVADDEAGDGDEGVLLRGVHTHYPVETERPHDSQVEALAKRIRQRRDRARKAGDTPIFDVDAEGPSLWFGGSPKKAAANPSLVVKQIHEHLAALTHGDDGLDWESRRQVMEALRRAMLRISVLVRLLPTKKDRDEQAWGDLLVQAFWAPGENGQHESMAHRIEVFLEDLRGASGSFDDPESAKATLLDATKLRDQRFVALVKGGDQKGRERVFAGFNTPLLPDVLVCTSVGAEGIDLHRHCRHVVHYDLAWNPAVLEQRTGRIDRIGSKTFRERDLAKGAANTFLEVGVPFLAGTYDERMYEELRLRAQIFEVLTGGDVAADNPEGNDDGEQGEGKEIGLRLLPLPPTMVDDLRVRLHVWEEGAGDARKPRRKPNKDVELGPSGETAWLQE